MKKTYLIAVRPTPYAVPVKKEWTYKGFQLFLHRNYGKGYSTNEEMHVGKDWRISEVTTGLSAGGQTFPTMAAQVAYVHKNIDDYLCNPAHTLRDLLAPHKILNP